MKKEVKDCIVIGFALFAMFFGAGNLIFPPHLGFLTGSKWLETFAAFALTGIGLPMLGIFAVGKAGGNLQGFAGKVHPLFAYILGTIIILEIGPILAMPRTAATTYEISVLPFAPQVSPIVSSIVFFSLVLLVSVFPSKVVNAVGKYLTPMLIIVLAAIIIRALITPLGTPQPAETSNFFRTGFLEGYQTMDTLASMMFATIVMQAIKACGYTDERAKIKLNIAAGVIAALGLMLVYGGLMYAGACSGKIFPQGITRTALLIGICGKLWGIAGKIILAISMMLACFTTAVGLTATTGHYFANLSKNKVPYTVVVIIVCVVSCWFSVYGVENIIRYSVPLLQALYPVCIFLTFMNLIDRFIPNRFFYIGGTVGTLTVSTLDAISSSGTLIGRDFHKLSDLLQRLPLSNLGIAWVIPAAAGALLAGFTFGIVRKRTAASSSE